ncbi:uncharacterized protein BJX67DRAFT_385669 [Aspergillus lucknowensis]|uniref:Serine protease n=1 Tax=Aspergillus lucknowensis TaxID=176173 RepID=A0ABR4LCZ2_9EURO
MSSSSSSSWTLPPEYMHEDRKPGWRFSFLSGFQLEHNDSVWKQWVARLDFRKDGHNNFGTAFYVNVPGATYNDKPADVILTAAHNLVQTKKELSNNLTENLTITSITGQVYSVNPGLDGVIPCPAYFEEPDEWKNDWGMILIPRFAARTVKEDEAKDEKANEKEKRKKLQPEEQDFGFEFNLFYALAGRDGHDLLHQLCKSNMFVGGYTSEPPREYPRLSALKGTTPRSSYLKYQSATEPGLSGSPIWGISEKKFTVVGIHTGKESKRAVDKARGVRLTFDIFEKIFERTGVGYHSTVLRTNDQSPPEKALYLRFTEYAPFGLVHLGRDGLNTSFDILPAVSIPGKDPQFVFRFIKPAKWRGEEPLLWVRWEPDRNRATLSATLHPDCLVTLIRPKDEGAVSHYTLDGSFNLATVAKKGVLYLESTNIRQHDGCYGTIESAGVSFETMVRKNKNDLTLEKSDAQGSEKKAEVTDNAA